MKHELPELPYDEGALEPHMSRETLEYHHGKHHAAYVSKLNGLIEGTAFASSSLEDIVKSASGGIFNNGAQAWNHAFFWNCLSPDGGGNPQGELAAAIQRDFGGFATLKQRFFEALTTLFGSGWVWLSKSQDGSLTVEQLSNAGNPMTSGKVPLLTCDMWEHAYYIDYRNEKAKYENAFWSLVNWDFVADNYVKADAS
ncbi:MAG: superoxide dismutase [Chromatiaceae bacterium]|jgi:superoxide dismutase, Fe-Mn family